MFYYFAGLDFKRTSNNEKLITTKAIQLQRITHFKKTCARYGFDESAVRNVNITVLHSERYKLATKIVPKVGSTFMIQAFHILTESESTDVFKRARSHLHEGESIPFRDDINIDALKEYTVLINGRNPYSRLYSAYVDKVFVFNNFDVCMDVYARLYDENYLAHDDSLCRYDITFEQFLQYRFDAGGMVAAGHYNPIMSLNKLSSLCSLPKIMIIKQESFSDDVDLALRAVKVKGRVYDVLYNHLHAKRGKSTIIGIVETVYEKLSQKIDKTCLKWKDIAKKLWKSFQIQGYIRDSSDFPEEGKYLTAIQLISAIRKELKINPLTHEESIKQRNKALIKAYSDVDAKYIQKIREFYSLDFELFQYGEAIKV